MKREKGITLIALVITIIVLLILAGVTINLTLGENGIFKTAEKAATEHVKTQLKEELELEIVDIQTKKIEQKLEMKREYLTELSGIGAIVESTGIPALGEYKDYEFTVDENYKVTIGEKLTGVKPEGIATVITTGTVIYGNKAEIKVTASTTEGSIASITPTNGAVLKTDTSATEKTFEVGTNGKYYFMIQGDNGRKRVVSVEVTNIILPTVTAEVTEIKSKKFTIGVTTDYPAGMVTEYKYYVDGEEVNSGTTNTTYTVTGLNPTTKYKVYIVAYDTTGNSVKSSEQEVTTTEILPPSLDGTGTTHTAKQITYSWEEINAMAEVISNNYGTGTNQINNRTAEVKVEMDGEIYTLGVGDYTTLNSKQIRILGFNHDTLTNTTAYGEGKTNIYAGISFEFVNFITSAQMNSANTNTNGWGACTLRTTLNSTTYDSLQNKAYIKQVSKKYIKTYNNAGSVATSNDYLWLLSCSEIWNNGEKSGMYGWAITKEGEQYKYYANINASFLSNDSRIRKDPDYWWLRSTSYEYGDAFCRVRAAGSCMESDANISCGIAPGFAI